MFLSTGFKNIFRYNYRCFYRTGLKIFLNITVTFYWKKGKFWIRENMWWAHTKIFENYYDHPLLFQMGISLLNSKVQEEWSAYFYCFVFDLPNFYSGEIFQPQHWTSIHDVDCPHAFRPVKFNMWYLVFIRWMNFFVSFTGISTA